MIHDCQSFPGYCADDQGNVYSKRRRTRPAGMRHGSVAYIGDNPRVLAAHPNAKGYLGVGIRVDGAQRHVTVHTLVADALHGPRPDGMEVRHLDGDHRNNAPGNLAYGTSQENVADRVSHGGYRSGGGHHNARLSDQQAADIRGLRSMGSKVRNLAEGYGVSVATVKAIIYGRSYKNAVTFRRLEVH